MGHECRPLACRLETMGDRGSTRQIVNDRYSRGLAVEPVTRARERLEHIRASDPGDAGESHPEFKRILTESPLTVRFALHPDERLVYVLGVNYTPPRHRRP